MDHDMPPATRVEDIRERLSSLQNEHLKVRANLGRSRIIERMGLLVATHPSLFVVELEERRGRKSRQSYQYVDVLTGMVELFDPESGEALFDFEPAPVE